jgi:hypothetical protein
VLKDGKERRTEDIVGLEVEVEEVHSEDPYDAYE